MKKGSYIKGFLKFLGLILFVFAVIPFYRDSQIEDFLDEKATKMVEIEGSRVKGYSNEQLSWEIQSILRR